MTLFIDRRVSPDRRHSSERRQSPRLDLSHKRRRNGKERRETARTLAEDFYAKDAMRRKQLSDHSHH